jgi:hypothetical protein
MESSQIQPRPSSNILSIAQLIVSGLGILSSLLAAGGIAILGLVGLFSESVNQTEVTPLLATAWISVLVAVLAVPSLVYSIQRLWNWTPALPHINSFRLASILLLVWPLVLLLGNLIARSGSLAWLLLPPLGMLAVGLPIWWLVEFTRRKVSSGSLQRSWGLVSFSMLITTPVLMLVEILTLLVLVLGFAVWLSTQPELVILLQRLVERLSIGQPDAQEVIELVSPYLQNPWVIFAVLAVVAGVVPLIEELLKPLAMWALAGHHLTPAQGFAAGAICGGTFALIESLFYLSSPMGADWAVLAAGRAGTGLLHITTTALLGWALAAAWQDGSYLRLGATYLLSCALHGLWNALSILGGLAGQFGDPPANINLMNNLGQIAKISLGVLIVSLFLTLWWSNRRLARPAPDALVDIQA